MWSLAVICPKSSVAPIGRKLALSRHDLTLAGPLQHRKGNLMLQHFHLFLDWVASPLGFNYIVGLLGLGIAFGLNQRAAAGWMAALSFWLAFH